MVPERALQWLLRITGACLLLATVFLFMPNSWFAAIYGWLGFADYPTTPVFEYLVRTVIAMYALSGAFCWLVAVDVRRHAGVIMFLGEASILFGIVCTVVDFWVGLPWFWKFAEGPMAIVLGIVVLVLQARIRARF